MVKKSSMLTSVVLGVVGGTAAAVFLATKTGKAVKEKVAAFATDYKENHEEIHADLIEKAQELGKQATDKFVEVKGQLESGDLSVEELVKSGCDKSLETIEQIKEKITEGNYPLADFFSFHDEKNNESDGDDSLEDDQNVVASGDIEIELSHLVVKEPIPSPVDETASEEKVE